MSSAPGDARLRTYRRRSPSPPHRHGRTQRQTREVVVQRVVKEVSGTPYPQLTRTNYEDWSLLMRVKLEARGLWDAVEHGDADRQEDRMAVDAILSAVPAEMIRPLASKHTTKEAWEAIKSIHVGSDRAKKMTLQRLRRDWDLLSFRDGEQVDDFALRLSGMMSSLSIYGEQVSEQNAVENLLRVVPDKYAQIALSIMTLLDTDTLTIEEVTGRLKMVDERPAATSSSAEQPQAGGKLYLTEEQWEARWKERNSGEGSSAGGCRTSHTGHHRPPRKQKKQGGSGGNRAPRRDSSRDPPRDQRQSYRCLNCGKYGHWAKDCRKPRRVRANLAEEEDDGPTLLMAEVCAPLEQSTLLCCSKTEEADAASPKQSTPALFKIHLEEPRAQLHLNSDGNRHADQWYLDTGATNHMTGR